MRFEGWLDLGWDLRCVRWGAQGGTRLNLYPGRAQCCYFGFRVWLGYEWASRIGV